VCIHAAKQFKMGQRGRVGGGFLLIWACFTSFLLAFSITPNVGIQPKKQPDGKRAPIALQLKRRMPSKGVWSSETTP
jgi:hypothetical protein